METWASDFYYIASILVEFFIGLGLGFLGGVWVCRRASRGGEMENNQD